MLQWSELVLMSNEQLTMIDIAEEHLACAHGIPGSDAIGSAARIRKLDEPVPWIQRYTAGCTEKCRQEFSDTEGQARMPCLLEVLWRGAGIRYDSSAIPEDAPWKFEHAFIHRAIAWKSHPPQPRRPDVRRARPEPRQPGSFRFARRSGSPQPHLLSSCREGPRDERRDVRVALAETAPIRPSDPDRTPAASRKVDMHGAGPGA